MASYCGHGEALMIGQLVDDELCCPTCLVSKIARLRNELEEARKENEAHAKNKKGTTGATYAHLVKERDELKAKITQLEKVVEAAKVADEPIRSALSKLDSQIRRNPDLPTCYRDIYALSLFAVERIAIVLRNLEPIPSPPVEGELLPRMAEMLRTIYENRYEPDMRG